MRAWRPPDRSRRLGGPSSTLPGRTGRGPGRTLWRTSSSPMTCGRRSMPAPWPAGTRKRSLVRPSGGSSSGSATRSARRRGGSGCTRRPRRRRRTSAPTSGANQSAEVSTTWRAASHPAQPMAYQAELSRSAVPRGDQVGASERASVALATASSEPLSLPSDVTNGSGSVGTSRRGVSRTIGDCIETSVSRRSDRGVRCR